MNVDCLTENEILARVSGALPPERAAVIDAHVDACAECRVLLAEAAHWLEEPRSRAASTTTFAPGEIVAKRYVITQWLGAGGMGEVYEAHDELLDEDIALKTVVPMIADDARALSRLHAEVRMARRVTHDNVCRVYDLGSHERNNERIWFLTMELVRGITLRRHLHQVGRLDFDTARPLIVQMIAALRHAHAAGIIHRDFKSDNVLLVPAKDGLAERVVVTDFGLARQSLVAESQPLTPQSRTVLGTLDYMSPEQVMGKPATPSSDVYSLGVVIYEMLTGQLPFQGDSPLARAVIRVTQAAPRLDAALPHVGAGASACIARCLEKDPERRFATVDQVLEALVDGRPASHPSRRALAGAAILAIALGGAALAHLLRSGFEVRSTPGSAGSATASALHETPVEADVAGQGVAPQVAPSLVADTAAPPASTALRATHQQAAAEPREKHRPQTPASAGSADVFAGSPRGRASAHTDELAPPVPSGDALLDPFGSRGRAAAPVPTASATGR